MFVLVREGGEDLRVLIGRVLDFWIKRPLVKYLSVSFI